MHIADENKFKFMHPPFVLAMRVSLAFLGISLSISDRARHYSNFKMIIEGISYSHIPTTQLRGFWTALVIIFTRKEILVAVSDESEK